MKSNLSWSILDDRGFAVGSWNEGFFWIGCYDSYKEAKIAAIALKIPNFKIVRAIEALDRKPSDRFHT